MTVADRPRYAALDGVRGLAAMVVLLYHVAVFTGADAHGVFGTLVSRSAVVVPIFFMLSGFLLYRPFVARQERAAPTRWRNYLSHRVLRIVPAYWVALTIMLLIPGLAAVVHGLDGVSKGNAWIFYGFLQTYWKDTAEAGIGQAWTLSAEAAFYVLLPLYAVFAAKLGVGRARLRRELIVLVAIGAGSAIARIAVYGGTATGGYPFNLTIAGTALWLTAGMALATVSAIAPTGRVAEAVRTHPGACFGTAAGCFLAIAFFAGLPARTTGGSYTVLGWGFEYLAFAVIGLLIMAPPVFSSPERSRVLRGLGSPPLRWLGRISFGVYLWHYVLLQVLMERGVDTFAPLLVSTLAVSLLAGVLSWTVIEKPVLDWADRRRAARRDQQVPLVGQPASG